MLRAAAKTMSFADTMKLSARLESGSSRLQHYEVETPRNYGYTLETLSVRELISVDQVLDRYKRYKSAMGRGPGPDGLVLDDLHQSDIASMVRTIVQQVRAGGFVPAPQREVRIKKDGGKSERVLSVANVCERLVASSANEILTGLIAPRIHPAFHGYLPGLGTDTLFSDIHSHLTQIIPEGSIYLVEMDIRGAFDNVKVDAVRAALLAHNIPEDTVRQLITLSGANANQTGQIGIPQGGALSPILFTATLSHYLGLGIPGEQQTADPKPVIYADNVCYIANSESEMREMIERHEGELDNIGLQWRTKREPKNLTIGEIGSVMGTQVSVENGTIRFSMSPKTLNRIKERLRLSITDIDPLLAARNTLISIVSQWGHIATTTEENELRQIVDGILGNLNAIDRPHSWSIVQAWREAGYRWMQVHRERHPEHRQNLRSNSNPYPGIA